VKAGADINARTNNGKGNTPLNLAFKKHGDSHPVSAYLISMGALDIGPDL
jgi:hypothetical protein